MEKNIELGNWNRTSFLIAEPRRAIYRMKSEIAAEIFTKTNDGFMKTQSDTEIQRNFRASKKLMDNMNVD